MPDSDLEDIENIINKLPDVIPRGPIDITNEEYLFRSEKDIYFLRKAPVSSVSEVTGTLNASSGHAFVQGTDYQLVDDDGDGEDDSIDWSIGGDSPDDNTDFFVDYRADAVISRYVDAHDTDVDDLETDINNVISAAQLANADSTDDLEEIGALFGEIGRRRGRNKESYRALLKSIVQSFKGRGTKPGMKFAIAAGIGANEEDITITEDTDNTGYEIQIASNVDTNIIGNVINDMAQLADPSGVKLLSDPVILIDGDTIQITKNESTVTVSSTGLGGGTLALDGTTQLPSPSASPTMTWDSGEDWDTSKWA